MECVARVWMQWNGTLLHRDNGIFGSFCGLADFAKFANCKVIRAKTLNMEWAFKDNYLSVMKWKPHSCLPNKRQQVVNEVKEWRYGMT